jgi:DNA-binding NarL/FixJ family response regulator
VAPQPRIKVLIADDDPGFLEALATAMEADGRFEVVGLAGNGAEAFQMACWHEPNVIVMDVEMPVIDGIEAARLLRESRPRTCVLMVSGGDEAVAHHASTTGAATFVSKSKFDSIPNAVARLASPGDRQTGGPPNP